MRDVSQSRGVPEAIRQARAYIAEHGICQGADARDALGRPTMPFARDAHALCITAALLRATRQLTASHLVMAVYHLAGALKRTPSASYRTNVRALQEWGDGDARTMNEVLSLFDLGIERAEAMRRAPVSKGRLIEYDGTGGATVVAK